MKANKLFISVSSSINVLSAGDWKTISGTSYTSQVSVVNHGAFNGPFGGQVGYTATSTYTNLQQTQTNVVGAYDVPAALYRNCPVVGAEEDPVPPLVAPSVPASVTTPVVAVLGVNPDNDVWKDVTPVLVIVTVLLLFDPSEVDTLIPVLALTAVT